MTPSASQAIRQLIDDWAAAVRGHDLDGVVARHDPGIVMFDVPPARPHGIDAYRDSWPPFFRYLADTGAFDIEALDVVAGDDVAFAFGVVRCGPPGATFEVRLTVGLRRVEGDWRILHEHHSVAAEG